MPISPALGNSEELDAFLKAARYGDIEEVQEMLKSRPELLEESDAFTKSTAMLLASGNGHSDIVKLLIKEAGEGRKSEVVNQGNRQGNTPLHWAALNGHLDVCKILVDAGADATTLNKAKRTPYDEALSRHFQDVCVYLAKFSAPESEPGTAMLISDRYLFAFTVGEYEAASFGESFRNNLFSHRGQAESTLPHWDGL